MSQIPMIDKSLIDFLSQMYPDVSPELSMTEREIFFRRGAVDVVRTLKRIHSDQNDNMLGDHGA